MHRQETLISRQGKIMSSMYGKQQKIVLHVSRLDQKYIKKLQCDSIKQGQARVEDIQAERQGKPRERKTLSSSGSYCARTKARKRSATAKATLVHAAGQHARREQVRRIERGKEGTQPEWPEARVKRGTRKGPEDMWHTDEYTPWEDFVDR